MLEQLDKSIQSYFYKKWQVDLYTKKVPASIRIPSLYFGEIEIADSVHTKLTFNELYLLQVKVFHKSTREALMKANELVRAIMRNKSRVPILNEDGTETGNYIHFTNIDTSAIDDNVAQITLTFDCQYNFD